MPYIELIRVTCDECGGPLVIPQTSAPNGTLFHNHSEATTAAEKRGWYVDAQHCLCPVHWPGTPDEAADSAADFVCCICDKRIPVHHAVINCGANGVACLSHEAELREWAASKRCTYCGNRAVASVNDKPLCAAHAVTRRGDV